MKYYFLGLKLDQPKNKAQKAAQEFAETYKDCLMDQFGLDHFLDNTVPEAINKINQEYIRCGDLSTYLTAMWRDKQERQLSITGGIYFSIRSVKRMELKKLKK